MHDFAHSDVLIFSARVSHSKRRKQKAKAEFGNGMFVRVAGELISYTIETDNDPINIDHFWIDISSGNHGLVRISLNTYSRSHAKANFDPRMRVAVFQSTWTELPSPGMYPPASFAQKFASHRGGTCERWQDIAGPNAILWCHAMKLRHSPRRSPHERRISSPHCEFVVAHRFKKVFLSDVRRRGE